MKKILLFVISALMLGSLESRAQIGLGVEAGYLNSGRYLCESGLNRSSGFHGAYVGVDYTLPLTDVISFVPGITCSYNTGTATVAHENTSLSSKVVEMYVGIPLDLKYSTPITSQMKLFIKAGPVISYGVLSTEEMTLVINKEPFSYIADCYKGGLHFNGSYKEKNYSPFEILAEVGGGIETGRIRLTFCYGYGVLDRYKGGESNCSIRRNQLKTGVAFVF